MAYTIIASWTAKPGEGEHIAKVLRELAPRLAERSVAAFETLD